MNTQWRDWALVSEKDSSEEMPQKQSTLDTLKDICASLEEIKSIKKTKNKATTKKHLKNPQNPLLKKPNPKPNQQQQKNPSPCAKHCLFFQEYSI